MMSFTLSKATRITQFIMLVSGFAVISWSQDTNRYHTGGSYSVGAPTNTRFLMTLTTTNVDNPGDNNLVWSHSGGYMATDRTPPGGGASRINLLGFSKTGSITNLGFRSGVGAVTVYANITDFTADDARVLYPNASDAFGTKCRLLSCTTTGAMDVREFFKDPLTNVHVYSPSVIYDQVANKERLLFVMSTNNSTYPTMGVDASFRWNVWTVTYERGGVPNWNDKVQLTAFTNKMVIKSAKWCPEIGTNYQPLVNRYALLTQQAGELYVFTGVRDILSTAATAPSNLFDGRFSLREADVSGSSQMAWTYDGNFLMYGVDDPSPGPGATQQLFSVRSEGPDTNRVPFVVPGDIITKSKQWLCISPNGMRAAFTVDKRVMMMPLQFENKSIVTNAGSNNIITDGSYTRVLIPGEALPSTNEVLTNFTFSILEPTEVDTNKFPTEFAGNAREFSVSGIETQINFMTNVTMSLHFEDSDVPDGVSATNLAIFLYNPTNAQGGHTGTWSQVQSTVDTNTHYVTSSNIQHFSIYALGAGLGAPAAPTGVSASKGSYTDRVSISWNAVSAATAYNLYRHTVDNTNGITVFAAGLTDTTYSDTSVTVDTVYYYWVQAVNAVGDSPFSVSDSGYATAALVAPDVPTGLSASKGSFTDRVRLGWNAAARAAEYEIWRNTVNDNSTATKLPTGTSGASFDDTTAGVGTNYYYWVKAKNVAGTSAFSVGDYGYASQAVVAPQAPSGVSVSKGRYTDRIQVVWNTSVDATSYRVYRNTVDNSATADEFIEAPVTAELDDFSAASGNNYYYWVKAVNAAGTSDFSASDSGFVGVVGPLITANGLVGQVYLNSGDLATIAVQMMNVEPYLGTEVDWWVVACANGAWYYLGSQWTSFSGAAANCHPVHQGALCNLAPYTVLNMVLPRGSHMLWFAVDYPMDGVLNLNGTLRMDKVTVVVQ